MATSTAVEQIYQKVLASLRSNGLVAPLQQLHSMVSEPLEGLRPADFPKAWLLDILALEWLKYSIEDDYIDADDVRPAATDAVESLLKSDDWISPKLRAFLEVYHQVAKKKAIAAQRVEVRIPTLSGDCRFLGWLAGSNQPPIPVSSQHAHFVPILEDSLADPYYANSLLDAFADRLGRLRDQGKVTCLCVVEKAVGPVGALSMVAALVSKVNLPACIYRAGYWPTRTRLTAYQPKPTDQIALVYDLLVTGDGLRQAAKDVRHMSRGATISAAVVLLGYDAKRDTLEVDNQTTMEVEAITWYEDLAPQIEEIRTKKLTKTENLTVVLNGRGRLRSPALGRRTSGSPSAHGGIPTDRSPRWTRSYGSYTNAELRALTFASVKEIDKAIDFCWSDADLRGVPRGIADGRTLIVPEEAVEYFRSKGLKFAVSQLVNPDELSPRELAERRRKYGM